MLKARTASTTRPNLRTRKSRPFVALVIWIVAAHVFARLIETFTTYPDSGHTTDFFSLSTSGQSWIGGASLATVLVVGLAALASIHRS